MMENRDWSSIQRERSAKHRKLIHCIESYKKSKQEVRKLEKIKVNTVMEINLRFLKSQHNRNYKFPKNTQQEDEQSNQSSLGNNRQNLFYDLMSQNKSQKGKIIPTKLMPFEPQEKKVKSLERQNVSLEKQRIMRLNTKTKQNSLKKLRKASIVIEKNHRSNVKLPDINTKRQNCVTQGTADVEISQIIGKKLATEIAVVQSKFKGVQKYVLEAKDMQEKARKRKNIPKFYTKPLY